MMEAARTIAADRSVRLVAPLIFNMNGGEETFSQVVPGAQSDTVASIGRCRFSQTSLRHVCNVASSSWHF